MPKIVRPNIDLPQFSGDATNRLTVFGTGTDINNPGTPATTIEQIVAGLSSRWGDGWTFQKPEQGDTPLLEDFNDITYVQNYLLRYLMQTGIAEWSANQEYAVNSFCQYNGILYRSLQDSNTNRNPATQNTYWVDVLGQFLRKDIAQTITAKHTFNVLPESSVVPTTNNQFTNKKYIDDNLSQVITKSMVGDSFENNGQLKRKEAGSLNELTTNITLSVNLSTVTDGPEGVVGWYYFNCTAYNSTNTCMQTLTKINPTDGYKIYRRLSYGGTPLESAPWVVVNGSGAPDYANGVDAIIRDEAEHIYTVPYDCFANITLYCTQSRPSYLYIDNKQIGTTNLSYGNYGLASSFSGRLDKGQVIKYRSAFTSATTNLATLQIFPLGA